MPVLCITNSFDKLSDAKLPVRTSAILTAMTGNANFPTLTLTNVQAALTALHSCHSCGTNRQRLRQGF